jgi:AcrR family transcriptional regulator
MQKSSLKTRRAILDAFNHVFNAHRERRIRVQDVADRAGVGRSTFYDHFAGVEAVQLASMRVPFGLLADAAVGDCEPERLEPLLRHFWDNRRRARDLLANRAGDQVMRLLGELVVERLEAPLAMPVHLAAQQLAGAVLMPVRAWLLGEAPAAPDALAQALCRSGTALAAALRQPA